jgi:hypothetical protein
MLSNFCAAAVDVGPAESSQWTASHELWKLRLLQLHLWRAGLREDIPSAPHHTANYRAKRVAKLSLNKRSCCRMESCNVFRTRAFKPLQRVRNLRTSSFCEAERVLANMVNSTTTPASKFRCKGTQSGVSRLCNSFWRVLKILLSLRRSMLFSVHVCTQPHPGQYVTETDLIAICRPNLL